MIEKGAVAPDFKVGDRTLYDMLAERAVVVFFFPAAFTPGCTREASAFGREHDKLRQSGCEVVGVSPDEQESSERFRASLGLPYPLVGDPDGVIGRAYDVRWPVIGRFKRVTYLIARNHKVRLALHDEFRMGAHAAQACAAATGEGA